MILLISKNKELANSFIQDVQQEGFRTIWISRYQDTIPTVYQHRDCKMVVFDIESSDHQATETIQRMKKDPQISHIPIICMLQKELVVEQLIAFEMGADEFLYVPYTTTELQLRIRSIERMLELQQQLRDKENQLQALRQLQRVLVTLSHHINNSLTPLYSLVQMVDESRPENAKRLKEHARRTVEFINKVLTTLNQMVQSGEMKVIQTGVYKNLMLDIESELKKLQNLDASE
ncbi:MAG: hypothetical protein Kow0042_20140 [Calditrichia bacterium]